MNFIGIDFGTSNSLAAIKRQGGIELLEMHDRKSVPSVLFFPTVKRGGRKPADNFYVGQSAIEQRFNEDENGRILFSFKGLLADRTFDKTIIAGHGEFTAEKLCGYFLKQLRVAAEKHFKCEILGVVLGRPVEFSDQAVARLEQAASIAGFKQVSFQLEPIAAGLNYEQGLVQADGEKLVFVCDIGGGTTDYAILRLSAGRRQQPDRRADILAVGGVYKAGDSLNSDVVRKGLGTKFGHGSKWGEKQLDVPAHWINALGNWKTLPFLRNEKIGELLNYVEPARKKDLGRLFTLVKDNLGYQLHTEIDQAKIALSSQDVTRVTLRSLDLHEPLSRQRFEGLIDETVAELKNEIPQTLRRAGLRPDQISTVLMTGGSSLVPALQRMVAETFAAERIISVDPFNSVVAGLALAATQRQAHYAN